ncbi:deoxyhypusine synthase family protein [bacterium]|nr:deoxyhypusine synthase family protein [bacterium]
MSDNDHENGGGAHEPYFGAGTSLFKHAPDIVPERLTRGMSARALVDHIGRTCFEARMTARAARLFSRMVAEGDVLWLGIAGAGVAGGMGGSILPLVEAGFVDVICSTGAQLYHDLHFAFGLPVKAIHPHQDDNALRERGDTRIYDIGIREVETLQKQDDIVCQFMTEERDALVDHPVPSWEFNHLLGLWAAKNAPHPDRSIVVAAAERGIPMFWDSHSNHSPAMNAAAMMMRGVDVHFSPQLDVLDSAAIAYVTKSTAFVELGGGGPKNFIQQTGPTISQILRRDYAGAERGLQIGTANEREGSLSSCTFGEAVTWGKYERDDHDRLIQVWGEYSVIFPMLAAYVLDTCEPREPRRLVDRIPAMRESLKGAI